MTAILKQLRHLEIVPDESQQRAITDLQEFLHQSHPGNRQFFNRINWSGAARVAIKSAGAYLWGPPGRGKTTLMDACWQVSELPKRRVHWLELQQAVQQYRGEKLHDQRSLSERARAIAQRRTGIAMFANIANRWRNRHQQVINLGLQQWLPESGLLCLDEFHIRDAANAALLHKLIKSAVQRRVKVILTSNYHPRQLFAATSDRHLIEATIDLLMVNYQIINLAGQQDYRQQQATMQQSLQIYPQVANAAQQNNQAVKKLVRSEFAQLVQRYYGSEKLTTNRTSQPIQLAKRKLICIGYNDNILYADFAQLCQQYLSYLDYLYIARTWPTVAIDADNFPQGSALTSDVVRRFIWLIDVLYNAKIRLILLLPAPPASVLAHAAGKEQDLQRCLSRLRAMNSPHFVE